MDDYRALLQKLGKLTADMAAAYQKEEMGMALRYADEIGALYFPDDLLQASRMAFSLTTTATALYYAGKQSQIREDYRL